MHIFSVLKYWLLFYVAKKPLHIFFRHQPYNYFFIQALHPLLEDGCPDDEEYEDYKKVYNRNIIYTFAEKNPVKLFF